MNQHPAPRRFLAEWETEGCILLALPDSNTDWAYMLPEATDQYCRIVDTLTSAGERVLLLCNDPDHARAIMKPFSHNLVAFIKAKYNDTWTRDYGPITILSHDGKMRSLDFGFNGWGLKFASNLDNLVNLQLLTSHIIKEESYRNNRDFTLEGGSIDTDGQGTILTTSRCLCSPNRNGGKSKAELNEILQHRLGATHVLWLDYGALEGDDTDSHIDTLARMVATDTIVYTDPRPDTSDSQNSQLEAMRKQLSLFRTPEGNPYNLVELPTPSPIHDSEGNRLPASYANYLITPKNLFVPTYGQKDNDSLACLTLASLFPDKKIHTVDCNALICQHGSLHCATMQLPKETINSNLLYDWA